MLQDWPHMVREAGENMGIFLTKLSNETRIILEHSVAVEHVISHWYYTWGTIVKLKLHLSSF